MQTTVRKPTTALERNMPGRYTSPKRLGRLVHRRGPTGSRRSGCLSPDRRYVLDVTLSRPTENPVTRSDVPDTGTILDAVADAIGEMLFAASVTVTRGGTRGRDGEDGTAQGSSSATREDLGGFRTTLSVTLEPRVAQLLQDGPSALRELLEALPGAGLDVAEQLGTMFESQARTTPAVRRAVRDSVAAEILERYFRSRLHRDPPPDLVADTIDYLIELSGTRVEAHDLTHGVVIADVLHDEPRLSFRYPDDVRLAKRAPLLFDGQQSVLIVDPLGRARSELQRDQFERLAPDAVEGSANEAWLDSGSLVALATRTLGGIGFFVRADRTVWTFVDGQPLLVRRGEHWTAFPMALAASIAQMIGGGAAAELVARAAYMISARPQGAILAIVDHAASIDEVVSPKDRYDLRDEIDPSAMRPETRLHHLIDASELHEHTVARLAALDGATVVDREGRLIAYGAIVTTADSEHEGARTAAARTLSQTALVVLKVSVDGDITVFRDGTAITTLLGRPAPLRRA
jgi:hypothetical protein